jgi:hypothetical protein
LTARFPTRPKAIRPRMIVSDTGSFTWNVIFLSDIKPSVKIFSNHGRPFFMMQTKDWNKAKTLSIETISPYWELHINILRGQDDATPMR